ncbi:MAG: fumarylacetoacetate hydrolase family protein, partial [Myroides sp.]
MNIPANNPSLKSWLEVAPASDFPIQNIPFGVFSVEEDELVIGTRIGDFAISLTALNDLGFFKDIDFDDNVLYDETLNAFISEGKEVWRAIRNRISEIFEANNPKLRDNAKSRELTIFNVTEVNVELPVFIGDYTDFYSSREHATNVGMMFRDPANALLPNWLHLPVGYHGRSSTIVPSGVPVNRPLGQSLPKGETQPVFGPSKRVDFELETAFITADANVMGDRVSVDD